MTAVVVLGMHRSGTSCLAGMLAAGGVASAGEAVRNWDNARGHHEMLDAIRLNEAVLAHSGGHWLAAPATVRWTDAHAAERDRLLAVRIAGKPALLKDPRTLLVLPFWRASRVPFRTLGIVRHPLAVARSLESWRELPLADGIALWLAHDRVLAADRAEHGYAVIDFDRPRDEVVAVLAAAVPELDTRSAAAAYADELVHHDGGDAPALPGLPDALALHRELVGATQPPRTRFPRQHVAAFASAVRTGDRAAALDHARAALSAVADPAAVLVPAVTMLVRDRAYDTARALLAGIARDDGLAELLGAKVALAAGEPHAAIALLEVACSVSRPYYQARQLLPQALRSAGRHAEARAALERLVDHTLYPHNPLATLAEWSWLDGDRERALAELGRAIAAAPPHRRGRLRTRRAEWFVACSDRAAAHTELRRAIDEDPGYERSRDVLAMLAT